MPRSAVLRLPPFDGFQPARSTVPLAVRLDVGVALPRVSLSARRSVMLAPLILGSGHNFKMIRPHAVPHAAQVVGLHSGRNNDPSVVKERPMRRPVPLAVVADPVGVPVVAEGSDPQPAGVGLVDAGEESLLGGPELIHAHKWQSTIWRHCA